MKDCRFIASHIAMEEFVKKNLLICREILHNNEANNTVEHKHTIVRTMQTMGIFDEDADLDTFLDHDDIVETPTVNKITNDSSTLDTDTAASSSTSSHVQINNVSINETQESFVQHILPNLDATTHDTSPITIESIDDVEINCLGYDADVYNGHEDVTGVTDVISASVIDSCDIVQDFNKLTLEDLNCFIETLVKKSATSMKEFTNTDLKQNINSMVPRPVNVAFLATFTARF